MSPSAVTVHVCVACGAASQGRGVFDAARAESERRGARVRVEAVECLAVCRLPVTVAFTAPGKWSYVAADLSGPDAGAKLVDVAEIYADAPGGLIPWAKRPTLLKSGVVVRVPPQVVRAGDG